MHRIPGLIHSLRSISTVCPNEIHKIDSMIKWLEAVPTRYPEHADKFIESAENLLKEKGTELFNKNRIINSKTGSLTKAAMSFASLLPAQHYPLDPIYAAQPQNWKNLLFSIPNWRIYLVNGNYVRKHFDIDFSLGGNPGAYHFVPRDEIWIEDTGSPSDIIALCIHELTEAILMKRRFYSYDKAHAKATIVEKIYRDKADEMKLAGLFKSEPEEVPVQNPEGDSIPGRDGTIGDESETDPRASEIALNSGEDEVVGHKISSLTKQASLYKTATNKMVKLFQAGRLPLESLSEASKLLQMKPRELKVLGEGGEGIVHLMTSPQHGLQVRKTYNPHGHLPVDKNISTKEQLYNVLKDHPDLPGADLFAKYYGRDAKLPITYHEYIKGEHTGLGNIGQSQINEITNALHGHGLSVGDLHSYNTLKTESGPKIIDFLAAPTKENIGGRDPLHFLKGLKDQYSPIQGLISDIEPKEIPRIVHQGLNPTNDLDLARRFQDQLAVSNMHLGQALSSADDANQYWGKASPELTDHVRGALERIREALASQGKVVNRLTKKSAAEQDNTLRNTAIGATGLTAAALAAKKYAPQLLKSVRPCSAKCRGKACKAVCALKYVMPKAK